MFMTNLKNIKLKSLIVEQLLLNHQNKELSLYLLLKNTWHFLMKELLLLKKFIMWEGFSYIINFFNSNNSFRSSRSARYFLMDYK